MKIHEYQAKELFHKYGINVPHGEVAFSVQQAIAVAKKINKMPVVIKAQIHAGGRGKGGGVRFANSIKEVEKIANEILGMTLITNQTSPKGQKVKKILIEESLNISKELYISLLPDRNTAKHLIIASTAGGMEIEEIAKNKPDKIINIYINPLLGLQSYHSRQILFQLNIPPIAKKNFFENLYNLYKMFTNYDCSLLEINPLILTSNNQIVALDAKIDIDSNSLYRHNDILTFRDTDEEEPLEVKASKHNLNYIKLDGSGKIGNMVNGAGLALATMDIIKKAGAEPANFLDVGGGASSQMIENGFKIILDDINVKGILINIFGGILRCDVLAKGVVQAAKKIGIPVPVVIRMEGTNIKEGRNILTNSGLNFIMAKDLKETIFYITQIASNL